MNVKILEIRLLTPEKPLKAFVDVQVEGWVIHDFRVIKQNGQKAFVSPPQVSWKDPESGEIRYKPILTVPPELKWKIDAEILHVYQGEVEKRRSESNKIK